MKHIKIQFKNWELPAFKDEAGEAWVAIKPIAEAIGINYPSQYTKIKGNPAFNCCDITMVAEDGKSRTMVCLPVRQLYGWLYGINSRKVKAEIAPALLEFQKEVHTVLEATFYNGPDKEVVQVLTKMVEQLREMLDEERSQRQLLEKEVRSMGGFQASIAGQTLAQRKKQKPLTH